MKKSWFRNLFARQPRTVRTRTRPGAAPARPLIEALEDRCVPALFFISPNQITVDETAGTAQIVVSRQITTPTSDTVDFATAGGSATSGADFTPTSGTLTFPANTQTGSIDSMTITVPITNDTLDEADETFTVTLSNPSAGSSLSSPSDATVTITDDDPLPVVTTGDISVVEGPAGTTQTANVPLTLSAASGQDVIVAFATADGTATAGSDYTSTSGSVTIPAGQTSATIPVLITGDVANEGDETFTVAPHGGDRRHRRFARHQHRHHHRRRRLHLSIGDATVTEGDTGTVDATFTVTLSAAQSLQVTVDFATADNTAGDADYNATSGTLTFAPGVTTQTLAVQVNGDTVSESDETFFVNLSNAVNAAILDGQGTGTITDDDAQPTLSIADFAAAEVTAAPPTSPSSSPCRRPAARTSRSSSPRRTARPRAASITP